jgi:hypothetical protein
VSSNNNTTLAFHQFPSLQSPDTNWDLFFLTAPMLLTPSAVFSSTLVLAYLARILIATHQDMSYDFFSPFEVSGVQNSDLVFKKKPDFHSRL